MMLASRSYPFAIRRVSKRDLAEFTSHLLRLDRPSRRLRYGYTVSDETVRTYAEKCLARNAIVYAYFKEGMIRGVGELHLARYGSDGSNQGGELAFSVELDWRRRGIGTALAERLLIAACNRHVTPLSLSCSPENDAMLALARKYAACLTYDCHGSIKGELPTKRPTLGSCFTERAHIGIAGRGAEAGRGAGLLPAC